MMNQIFLKVLLHFLKETQATDMVCLVNLFLQESEIKVDSLPQIILSFGRKKKHYIILNIS